MWHKAIWKGHLMRLELTRVGLLVELANHYTTRGVRWPDARGEIFWQPRLASSCVVWHKVLLPDIESSSSQPLDPNQPYLLHVESDAMWEDEWRQYYRNKWSPQTPRGLGMWFLSLLVHLVGTGASSFVQRVNHLIIEEMFFLCSFGGDACVYWKILPYNLLVLLGLW